MKKIISISITVILFIIPIYSIGFEFHTFEVRTNPEFAKGVFPTSLIYQFDFPIPSLISDWDTEIDYRIDNGLDFRTLRQDPDTGKLLLENPADYPTDYIAIYDEMNMVFGQGFLDSPLSEKDLFKLWLTYDVRFENYYERLSFLTNPSESEGLFIKIPKQGSNPAVERFPSSTWTGQPELAADRSTINMSMSLGLDINLMEDRITRRNGMNYSFWTRLNPKWFDAFNDGTQDFLLFWNKLELAFTPVAIKQQGERDTTWFSIVLDNSTTYRYITGTKVPYYVQKGFIFGQQAINTEHVITNRTSLTFYGPQINSYDCYPDVSAFIDIGVNFGNLLNTGMPKSYNNTIASVGIRAEFVIFNIANFYYEIGYIVKPLPTEARRSEMRFGFSFGV